LPRATLVTSLRALESAQRAVVASQADLLAAVVVARECGATWQRVATCLGVSHQAARKRFGGIREGPRGG